MKWPLLLAVGCILVAQEPPGFYPFAIPLEGSVNSAADWSWMNEPRAGYRGQVRLRDGHFYSGQNRLRWVGVNISVVPQTSEEMLAIASHLARFGVNIVRFHHIDSAWEEGVFGPPLDDRRRIELQPAFMQRLVQFMRVLASKGIYVNMNLLTGRNFTSYDGLPSGIDSIDDFKVRHTLGFWYRPLLELQKRYARDLLTWREPNSQEQIKDASNLAMVEINNEAGLIHSWQLGYLDDLPTVFEQDLQRQWNDWLVRKVGDELWIEAVEGQQAPDSGYSQSEWQLERHAPARAQLRNDSALRLTIDQVGTEDWHVQLVRPNLNVVANGVYELYLEARASVPRRVWIALAYNRPPWTDLGWSNEIDLGTEWRVFRLRGRPTISEAGARLIIGGLGLLPGWVQLREVRLMTPATKAENRRPSRGEVPILKKAGFSTESRQVQVLWGRFLRDLEESYWRQMVDYVRRELRVGVPIAATITSTTSPHLSTLWDVVDAHFYWQHPEFPARAWDRDHYFVGNQPLVSDAQAGGLLGLAALRQAGRPYMVTEYGHPAPNLFAAEGVVFCGTLAAVQDWDGYFAYNYQPPAEGQGIRDYFDTAQQPTAWAGFGVMAQVFRQGLVKPSDTSKFQSFPRDWEDDLNTWYAWEGPSLRRFLEFFDSGDIWRYRIGMTLRDRPSTRDSQGAQAVRWSVQPAILAASDEKAVVVSGFIAASEGEEGRIRWKAKRNQSGWGQILLVQNQPERWLLVAHGVTRPKGMYQPLPRLGEKLSGPFWEKTRVEVEPLVLDLQIDLPSGYRVWALDGRGARNQELPVKREGRRLAVSLGQERTIWYEITPR